MPAGPGTNTNPGGAVGVGEGVGVGLGVCVGDGVGEGVAVGVGNGDGMFGNSAGVGVMNVVTGFGRGKPGRIGLIIAGAGSVLTNAKAAMGTKSSAMLNVFIGLFTPEPYPIAQPDTSLP